jgi:uncharacterized phage-associated protein
VNSIRRLLPIECGLCGKSPRATTPARIRRAAKVRWPVPQQLSAAAVPTAATSSFDVAHWFLKRARAEQVPLPPVRLQRMLYLAQAHFAASTRGKRLMPSVFVAATTGPIEPNLARIRDLNAPIVEVERLRRPVEQFLEGVWLAFGALPKERLDQLVLEAQPVKAAMLRGPGTEIALAAMADFHTGGGSGTVIHGTGEAAAAKSPRYHRGKRVTKWVPGQKRRG